MGKNNVNENRVSNLRGFLCAILYKQIMLTPYLVFSRDQRGFNVANTSIDENINESDASKGECYIIRYG